MANGIGMMNDPNARLMMLLGLNLMGAGGEKPGNVGLGQRLSQAGLGTLSGYDQFINQAARRKMSEKRLDVLESQLKLAEKEFKIKERTSNLMAKYAGQLEEMYPERERAGDAFMPGAPIPGVGSETERRKGIGHILLQSGSGLGSPGHTMAGLRTLYPEMFGQFTLPEGVVPEERATPTETGPGIFERFAQMFAPETPTPYTPRTTTFGRMMMPEPQKKSLHPQNIAPTGGPVMPIGELPPDWETRSKETKKIWATAYRPFMSDTLRKRLESEGLL